MHRSSNATCATHHHHTTSCLATSICNAECEKMSSVVIRVPATCTCRLLEKNYYGQFRCNRAALNARHPIQSAAVPCTPGMLLQWPAGDGWPWAWLHWLTGLDGQREFQHVTRSCRVRCRFATAPPSAVCLARLQRTALRRCSLRDPRTSHPRTPHRTHIQRVPRTCRASITVPSRSTWPHARTHAVAGTAAASAGLVPTSTA